MRGAQDLRAIIGKKERSFAGMGDAAALLRKPKEWQGRRGFAHDLHYFQEPVRAAGLYPRGGVFISLFFPPCLLVAAGSAEGGWKQIGDLGWAARPGRVIRKHLN